MTDLTREDREELRRLLVGKHGRLYIESAAFYNAVNTLVEMLPAMVDGLAAQAADGDAMLRAQYDAAKHAGMLPSV